MRILHLNSLLKGGGTDDRSVRIAHALSKLGHQTWLAGPAGREFSRVAADLGIPFLELESGFLKSKLIFRTARFIREHRIDVLHARHGRDYWPAIFAALLSGQRPKIVLSRHLAKSPSAFSRRFLLGQCDAFVAVSDFVVQVLKQGHSDPQSDNPERHYRAPMKGDLRKIRRVYGGFDMDRFQPANAVAQRQAWGLAPENYAFAVVGGYSLPRGKGQPEFLRAAALIHGQVPHARFLIIGRGNMKDLLEGEIRRLGLEGIAWLTPYSYDMPAALNAIDCLVLPQTGTEAIPGVVCEAHACGKPVVASDLDGIPEAFHVTSFGRLVERGSVNELAEAMKYWAAQPPLSMEARREMHRKVAEIFSLERAARELAQLYRSLMPDSGGGR
jgi:glycosyltransferase involved in cell wall biosynthesis